MGGLPQFWLQSNKDFRLDLISSSPATAWYAYLKMERHWHLGAFITLFFSFSQKVRSNLVSGICLQMTENTIHTDRRKGVVIVLGKIQGRRTPGTQRMPPGSSSLHSLAVLSSRFTSFSTVTWWKTPAKSLRYYILSGPNPQGKRAFSPWNVNRSPEPASQRPSKSHVHPRPFADQLSFDAPAHPRYWRWSQSHSNQMDWE